MKMKKQLVEEFSKETDTHEIRLIAGIDPNPPDPHSNTMFYFRMESKEKETDERCKVEPIWRSLNEMIKLSVLMTVASKFWEKKLEKGSWHGWKRAQAFIDAWNQMSDSMDTLLEE
jgi:hypothetical protein